MIPIDLQLSSCADDSMGVLVEYINVESDESLIEELYTIFGDDLNLSKWNSSFFIRRIQDGLYLSVHSNRKHVYWSKNRTLSQLFRNSVDGKLKSCNGTFISRLDNKSSVLWQIDNDPSATVGRHAAFSIRLVEETAFNGKYDYLKDLMILNHEDKVF
tara:strand:+ start:245 stop:718 length:474 start_codon:yes stop_codon:yes gene_type:complete